jgi:serine/threonine protein phosphatase PrpC
MIIDVLGKVIYNYFKKKPTKQARKMSFKEKREIKKNQKRMGHNCIEALKEHAGKFYSFYKGIYAPVKSVFWGKKSDELSYRSFVAAAVGKRRYMEDAHFCIDQEEGVLAGVFDGHNGSEVAQYSSYRMQECFFALLREENLNVYQVFKDLFAKIQEEIGVLHPNWSSVGSTAVVSYIERATNHIYTATLGDSEAVLYRIIRKKRKIIPLSCLRNWSSKRDFASAKEALGEEIVRKNNPKEMRHPPPGMSVHSGCGLNVSRALGDIDFKGVIHSPKITLTTLLPQDIVILACDGLRDFVSEKEILECIELHAGRSSLVDDLVDYSINIKGSMDNVTVLGIFVN